MRKFRDWQSADRLVGDPSISVVRSENARSRRMRIIRIAGFSFGGQHLVRGAARNAARLLPRFIGLPQNDVKVSLTRSSLAFRVARDLFRGCDCRITTRHA